MKNDDMELVRGSGNEQQFLASVEEGKQALRDGKWLSRPLSGSSAPPDANQALSRLGLQQKPLQTRRHFLRLAVAAQFQHGLIKPWGCASMPN